MPENGRDEDLLAALRARDERVFCDVVSRWSGVMLRLALAHVGTRAVAEEVVQEAWLTVLRSLDRFEGRSALRTWVLGIVVNVARARARAESRAERKGASPLVESAGPSVDPARFLPADHPRWPRHWALEPVEWRTPEDELLASEARAVIDRTIAQLPPAQREVLLLRDVEGMGAAEACNALGLSDTHQRVLLHRARSRVRSALERYLAATEAP